MDGTFIVGKNTDKWILKKLRESLTMDTMDILNYVMSFYNKFWVNLSVRKRGRLRAFTKTIAFA